MNARDCATQKATAHRRAANAVIGAALIIATFILWIVKWDAVRADATTCPTAEELQSRSKGRYTEVIEAKGTWQFWKLTQIVDGWAIYHNSQMDDLSPSARRHLADRFFFIAVKKSTIEKTLMKGDSMHTLANYLGMIDEVQGTDHDGFPVRIQRFEAIYTKGCK